MAFNDVIKWPGELDVFPTLENNTGGSIKENQIVYAQHYNKVRNCVIKMQDYLTGDTVASGDGSIKGVTTQISLYVPLNILAQIYANTVYAPPVTIPNYPGNVLPFEFVYATSTDSQFWNLQRGAHKVYEKVPSLQDLNNLLSGLTFLDVYQVAVTVWDATYHFGGLWDLPVPLPTPRKFITNHTTMKDTEGMIVKGCVIDYNDATPNNGNWDTYDNIFLVCSVFGVKAS